MKFLSNPLELFRTEDGELSEGRIFAVAGKAIICWMLVAFAASVLEKEWILLILVSALVAPKLFEKVLYMRAGGKTDESAGKS
jgi:hypothetical protein